MTQILQLLVIATAIVGLVIYGLIRDKQEHAPRETEQQSIDFPEHSDPEQNQHRGAAMSRL